MGISKHCYLPLNYFYQKGMSWSGYFILYYIKNSTVIKEPPKYIARTVRRKALLENVGNTPVKQNKCGATGEEHAHTVLSEFKTRAQLFQVNKQITAHSIMQAS